MGTSCVGCSSLSLRKPQYSLQPSDTQQYQPDRLSYKLQKLKFQAEINNIEILNYPWESISLKFSLNEIMESHLPKKTNQTKKGSTTEESIACNVLKWKYSQKFYFSMNQYELRKSFIKVQIFSQKILPILILKLNLYSVVTGPYHHDLLLDFGNQKYSRIHFDYKISQKCSILMNPLTVKVNLNEEFPGEQFSYSFNVFSCRKKVCSSQPSIPKKSVIFSNVQGNYRELKEEDQCESPTRIRKGTDMCKVIKTALTSKIEWQKPDTYNNLGRSFKKTSEWQSMPSFKFELKSNQISKSSIQLALWDICLNKNSLKQQALMFANTYIPLIKIFQTDYEMVKQYQTNSQQSQDNDKKILKKLEKRICEWSQNLIKDGKIIGKIQIKFEIISQIHFSQIHLHARTEDGIIYMTSMFKSYAGNEGSVRNNRNIVLIFQTFESLVKLLIKFNTIIKDIKLRRLENVSQLEEQIGLKFMKLNDKLTKSYDQSFFLNKASQIQNMIQSQNILLNIIQRIYIFLSDDNQNRFSQNCWKILYNIMKRGQFYLQHIGFNNVDMQNLQENIKQKKIAVAIKYMEMTYKILILALNQNYDDSNNMIPQTEAFKAYSYFRIPKFRQQLLKAIQRQEDDLIIQQKISSLFVNQKYSSKNILLSEQKSLIHLDWENNFYSYLQNFKESLDLNQKLLQELQQNDWMKNIAKRQFKFHCFIDYFAKKIKQLGKRLKLTRYSYCPGYSKIIKCFLAQMKKKCLNSYEASMIQTSMILMTNQNLINIIFPIVAEKTNILDNNCFVKSLNIISSYLRFLTQNSTKIITQKFNNCFFFKIIKNVLECQYSIGVAKMLVIIHNYFQCFNEELRQIISLFLLSKVFFKLFFHWSFNVRIIFYHLFLIKIYWGKINGVTQKENRMKSQIDENSQLYQRYKCLVKILSSVQFQKNEQKKMMKKLQKQDYYIKMRNKMKQKKNVNCQKENSQLKDSKSSSSSETIVNSVIRDFSNNVLSKSRLKRSQTLCSSQIKNYLKTFAKKEDQLERQKTISSVSLNNFQSRQSGLGNNCVNGIQQQAQIYKYCINLKINKQHPKLKRKESQTRNSFSVSEQFSTRQGIKKINDELNLNPLTLAKKKQSCSQQKQVLYSFFGHQDYELEQMTLNQYNTVLLGMSEFRQAQSFVQKYIVQKGVAPHIKLDPEIQMDSNQPRPC